MCGVAGYCGTDGTVGAQLKLALDELHHRGPDEQGTHLSDGVAMGAVRLSIIDVAGGSQPIYNEDGTVAVVYNGEIFNYRELRESLVRKGHAFTTNTDTEVLVHLYEEDGPEMVDHLRGMYAFAIHDARQGSVFLARDRFGEKPLYYSLDPSGLMFASEVKALRPFAKAAGRSWTISEQALADYLSLGAVPQPQTIYREVHSLPPASHATFQDGRLSVRRYWFPSFEPKTELPYPDAQAEAREIIGEAVRLRLRSDVPLGVFLSGGVDSSVVAYEASQALGGDLTCFTVSTGGSLDESALARETAQRLGVRHEVLPLDLDPVTSIQTVVDHYDQPFADSSAIPSLQVARLASEHVTVVLNGDGGDEVFAGYRRHVAAAAYQKLSWVPRGVASAVARGAAGRQFARRSRLGLVSRFARGMLTSPEERHLVWTSDMLRESDKEKYWRGSPVQPSERLVRATFAPDLSVLDELLLSEREINLPSALLVKMDMATMASSVEARAPMLDHHVAEFAWRLPDRFRIRRGVPKALLRDAYRPFLPSGVVDGPKRGFEIPLAEWLEGGVRPMLHDSLGRSNARVLSYVDQQLLAELLHGTGLEDRNRADLLYALLVLELWLEKNAG
jgi:asparagine synthase (glutamine-hydrolysing)